MLHAAAARLQKAFPALAARQPDGINLNHRLILFVVTFATMSIYFLPFLLLGKNSYITIFDNLDGEFVMKYLLVATRKALTFDGSSPMAIIMNGLPRAALPSGLNVSILLFYIFPPVWAYLVNSMCAHVIAFFGMFLLLRKHFLTDEDDYLLAGALSICFFLAPFYTTHGLTVAGQPLLAYAFLNIRNGQRNWKDYLIILLFPLWSNIALIAPFAVTALLLILAIDWFRSRRFNKHFFLAIVLFASAYAVLQYQLINSILGSNTWVSHRTTWNRWLDFAVSLNLKKSLDALLTTNYLTGGFSTLPIILAAGGALVLLIARKRRAGTLDVLAIAIALICLEFGFWDWIILEVGRFDSGLRAFNGSRYTLLLPLFWMLLFALSLKEFKRRNWRFPIVWCLVGLQALAILKVNTEFINSAKLLVGRQVFEPSFNRFFDEDLFAQIDKFIGRPKDSYRVVTLGIHPSVLEFDGFYTLDSYQNNYPLSYKLRFRPIIAKELDKDAALREYFDGWGNRCYIFTGELGLNSLCYGKWHRVVHNLQLDTTQLRAMGGEYVISAVEIENGAQHGLRLEKEFFTPDSFWHIYLYYVLPANPNSVVSVTQTATAAKDNRTASAGGQVP